MKDREATSPRQPKRSIPKQIRRPPDPPVPAQSLIVEDGLYFAEQIIQSLQISSVTLNAWVEQGLPVGRRCTKRRYFRGRDIMSFLFERDVKDNE